MMNENASGNTVVIVCPKKREGMSHLLAQLITEKYKEYEVAEWDDKHWSANKATVSASQKVIFIGNAGANYHYGTKWHFDKFSMKYGWRGNRAVLDVSMLNVLKVGKFKEYAQERAEDAEKIYQKMAGAAGAGIGAGAGVAGVGAAAGLAMGKFVFLMVGIKLLGPLAVLGGPAGIAIYINSLKKYQYPLLVKEFFESGFAKFMEG